MSFFKNVWADLVERRLWRVAVGLVVAMVAIPVVLGRGGGSGGGSEPAVVAPAAPASDTPAGQVVSLTTAKLKGAPLGRAHNPFRHLGGVVAAQSETSPGVTPATPAA